MDSKTELRTRFLKEFISAIIFNTPIKKGLFYPEINLETELKKGLLNQIENNSKQFEQIQIQQKMRTAPQLSLRVQEIRNRNPIQAQRIEPGHRIIQMNREDNGRMRSIPAKWEPRVVRMSDTPQIISRGNIPLIAIDSVPKLNEFINNPNIFSIECPGPGKPLTINQNGRINSIPLMLSENEINSLLEEISKKTRIPIGQGVFTAALGNKVITAIISEFVGTKFFIQRKSPPVSSQAPTNRFLY